MLLKQDTPIYHFMKKKKKKGHIYVVEMRA